MNAEVESYDRFMHEVVRFSQKELLLNVALRAADLDATEVDLNNGVTPWSLAAIARESLIHGSSFNLDRLRENSIDYLAQLHNNSQYAVSDKGEVSLWLTMAMIQYEQDSFQRSVEDGLMRSYRLWCLTQIDASKDRNFDWSKKLGGTLLQAMEVDVLLYSAARRNQGRILKSDIISGKNWEVVRQNIPVQFLERRIDDLTMELTSARSSTAMRTPTLWQRNGHNPLQVTPLVHFGSGKLVAPQPHFIIEKLIPENLYYFGLREWDEPFTEELGPRVESCTEIILSSISGIQVHREVRFIGKQNNLSVDLFVVTGSIVIMIECKAAFMDLSGRAGNPKAVYDRLSRYVSIGIEQINTTHSRWLDEDTSLEFLPQDKKVYGVIVTAGNLHEASGLISELEAKPEVSTLVASLSDLEELCGLTDKDVDLVMGTCFSAPMSKNPNIGRAVSQLRKAGKLSSNTRIRRDDFYDHAFPWREINQ